MDRWRGKVAIVTGASAGIGKAIACSLAQEGIRTVAIARRRELLDEQAKITANFIPMACDITDELALQQCIASVIEEVGDIHILINNAGLAHFGFMSQQNSDMWRKLMDTNVLALCVASRLVIAHMQSKNIAGQIININSVAGHCIPSFDRPIMGIYPASKHAVTAVTEQLRQEMTYLDTNIKISSLSPGYVYTDIHNNGGDTTNPNGMMPEDVADGVLYILGTKPNLLVKELTLKPLKEKF